MIPTDAGLLRLYVHGNDRWNGEPLYRGIVETARELHLAGASVFRVELSFGDEHRVHDSQSDFTFLEVPLIIEIVDSHEALEGLLERLKTMIGDGFATVEKVRVVRYVHHEESAASSG